MLASAFLGSREPDPDHLAIRSWPAAIAPRKPGSPASRSSSAMSWRTGGSWPAITCALPARSNSEIRGVLV